MDNQFQHKASLIGTGLVALAIVGFGGRELLTANNLAGLRALNIRAYGRNVPVYDKKIKLDVFDRVLLTAEGDYGTNTVALRSIWQITKGEEYGYFDQSCDSSRTCTFVAGDRGGEVTVHADANGFTDEVEIYIEEPEAPAPLANPFTDQVPGWAENPVLQLSDRQIINGYDDGRFGAGDTLTRGQLVTIFDRLLRQLHLLTPRQCTTPYQDVGPRHYAYLPTCTFRAYGWTDGLSTFDPDQPATRATTAALINRVVGGVLLSAQGNTLSEVLDASPTFHDVRTHHPNAADIAVVHALGLMRGDPNGTFRPSGYLNRAEAATVFWRIITQLEQQQIKGL